MFVSGAAGLLATTFRVNLRPGLLRRYYATLEGMGHLNGCRYVLHDRDAKFCTEFRETLAAGA